MRAIAQIKDAAAVHAKLKPVHDTFIKKNFKLTKDAYAAQHKDELDAFNKAVRTLMKLNGSTAVNFRHWMPNFLRCNPAAQSCAPNWKPCSRTSPH